MKISPFLITVFIGCLFIFPLFTNAQTTDFIKPGNAIYVTSNHPEMIQKARKYLQPGCWKLVDTPQNADFVVKIKAKRIVFVGMFAHALFIDPATKKILWKSRTSNTVMRVTFNNKRAVLKKLIRRRLLPLCYTYKATEY
jgi:hypothetical protein